MEFKGTKGKWKHFNTYGRYTVGNDENSHLSFIDCWKEGIGGIKTNEEAEANALLISKSPEMLEMLDRLVELTKSDNIEMPKFIQEEIEQLIKEATELI